MLSQPSVTRKKITLIKLVLAFLILVLAGVIILRGVDVRGIVANIAMRIRTAGPWAFFSAMALLPALGVPLLTFMLTAGSVFGERLGMGVVVGLSILAITVNMILSYVIARYPFRTLVDSILGRLGYSLPKVEQGDITDLAVILRVTPGIPFFVQNYLMGLACVPFGRYILISCLASWSYCTAFVLFGEALLHGKGKVAMIAGGLLVAATAVTHLVRRHYGRKIPDAEGIEDSIARNT